MVEDDAVGRDVDRRDHAVSYARIKALGFRTTVSIEEGVRELAKVLPWIDRPELFGNVKNTISEAAPVANESRHGEPSATGVASYSSSRLGAERILPCVTP